MATIYKRGKIYYIEYFIDGKKVKRSLGVKSKQMAEMKKAMIEADIEKGKAGLSPIKIRPLDALCEFKKEVVATKSKSTARRYVYSLRAFEKFLTVESNVENLKDLNKREIESFLRQRGSELKPKTYNEELGLLKQFYRWCIDQNYIFESPIEKTSRRHMVPPPPRAYTKEEVDIILKNANDAHRDIYEFLLNTGLRSGEMSHLEWNDVDLEKGIIYIRVKKDWHPKTATNRTVPLNAKAREIVERQPKRSNLVFTTRTGGSQFDIYNRFRYLIKKINEKHGIVIENPTIHAFRHTFATHALQSGIDIYTVSKYLGHTSVKMTEKYLTLLPDYAMQEIEKLKY